MKTSSSRRTFLKHTAAAGTVVSIGFPAIQAAESPGDKLLVGCMGLGRGLDHVNAILQISNVEIAYLCDIDDQRIERAAKVVGAKQERKPKTVKDFRRVLEDNNIHALFIAAPNHWHAPATILACSAGKHVYVEKPGSHNAHESELIVAAARKHKRVVQMGNQRRSWPWVIEAMKSLHDGEIGKVFFARAWYTNRRG